MQTHRDIELAAPTPDHFIDMPAMQQPEAYIGNAAALFDDKGSLANESTTAFLRNFMKSFESWIDRLRESPAYELSPSPTPWRARQM